MVTVADIGAYIGSGDQGSVWQHASEPDKVIKIMKAFPRMSGGELDAFQYDRYLERKLGSNYDRADWMFAPMANKMVIHLFRETMLMRQAGLSLPSGQVKIYAIEDTIFELKDMRRLHKIMVKEEPLGAYSEYCHQFERDWLTILSPGHRNGYLMVQEKLERIGGRSRAQGQERPQIFEAWSTFLWKDFGLVTRDTKNPGNYGFRANKELVIYDPIVAPLPEQDDWSSRDVYRRLRYAYFTYLFTDIPTITGIDEHDAHEVNKIIRRFERQIIAGNFYSIERAAEGFPGSYQPEVSLNDYGLRDIMYSGTASDNFQQTLANFGSETEGFEDIEWTQDTKKKIPEWQEEVEWNAPAPAQTKVRFPRAKADKIVATVESHIKPYVEKMMACGSYRRGAQMIGDIDFVVILKEGYTLPQILPPNQGINWVGDQKAQVIIDGEKVDFRVTTPEAWGATILYFTGPADFNIKYRWMAKKRGLKLSEYGLFNRDTDEYIAGATEEDIFTAMGRPYRDPADRKGFQRGVKKKAEGYHGDDSIWSKEEFFKRYKQLMGRDPTLKSVDFGDQDTGYMSSINRFDVSHTYNAKAAEDNYEATYGVEQAKIRRRLKNKIMKQAIMGTKAGQWSARKSQELKRQYEAACEKRGLPPYKGKKTQKQKDLSNWSKQGWRTGSGKKSSTTGEAYFPAKAVAALKEKGLYAKATRQKREATKAGKQRATYSKDIQQVVADYRAESTEMYLHHHGGWDRQIDILEDFPNAKNFDALINQSVGEEVKVLNSMEELLSEDSYNKLCYINFPLTVYRGVNLSGKGMKEWTWQRWLEDDKMGTSQNMGMSNTQPTTLNIQEALMYAGAGHNPNSDFELYAIDVQDYFVWLPRQSQPYQHKNCNAKYQCLDCNSIVDYGYCSDCRWYSDATGFEIKVTCDNPNHLIDMTPVIFILGGARYEDLQVIWDSDVNLFFEAEDKPVCPICEGYIPNDERPGAYPGAISRYDNKTEVCSACGTAEGVGMMMLGDQIYVLRDEAEEFTDDPWEIWCYIIANAKEQLPPVFFGRVP